VARFGVRFDAQGVLAGSKDAARCIGYLTKYLTKQVGDCHHADTNAQRAHAARLAETLRFQPCSPTCANWLRYGIQPRNARPGPIPGRCKGKAHDTDHLGYAGPRVLVSRKWSGKTLADKNTSTCGVSGSFCRRRWRRVRWPTIGRKPGTGSILCLAGIALTGLLPSIWMAPTLSCFAVASRTVLKIHRILSRALKVAVRRKGKGKLTLQCPPPLLALLQEHRKRQAAERLRAGDAWEDHDLVFATQHGGPIDRTEDWRAWKAILKQAGVRDVRVHDARHTAATLLSSRACISASSRRCLATPG
jgi:Replication initiator protein, pSAM2/Phage integrase family